jgi:hypothetical protein
MHPQDNNIRIMLFVKKDDAEGSYFYFMGDMKFESFEDTTMNSDKGQVPVVNIKFDMKTPVPQNLYAYLEG